MQQSLSYADCLQTPFVFSTNGDGFLLHDQTGIFNPTNIETELTLEQLPKPELLRCLFK